MYMNIKHIYFFDLDTSSKYASKKIEDPPLFHVKIFEDPPPFFVSKFSRTPPPFPRGYI